MGGKMDVQIDVKRIAPELSGKAGGPGSKSSARPHSGSSLGQSALILDREVVRSNHQA